MSIVIFDFKKKSPASYSVRQREVMAIKPGTDELKYIGYYKGQKSVFTEDVIEKNKDLKPTRVPEFVLNPQRNKCELRFDSSDKALLEYLLIHPDYNKKFELYSEEIESEKKLNKAEQVEKALELIKESDELKIRALGLSVLGIDSYNQSLVIIKSDLKDKAINSPKEVINAFNDSLFENKFIASLALCSGIVETNSTMTAIVWGDNKGRLISIATGEDFITKFAKHLSEKTPDSQALLQELGTRLELSKKAKSKQNKEADEIAELKAKLAEAEMEREIAEKKLANAVKTEPTLEELAIVELREKYKELVGNVPPRYVNDAEWLQSKIDEKQAS